MATETQSLEQLSRFENLFHKMNLLLGLRIWLRTTGIMMLANFGAALAGLIQAAPELAFLSLAVLNIYLFQRAASSEARVRYGLPVSPWCWWSINWRLIVYLLPVAIVLVIAGGPIDIEDDNRPTQKELERLGYAQLIIALLSINLAIINFLPIPVLDGGHLLFFMVEAVTRRPVNTRTREVAQQAGIFILIMLMIFVFYNDITRIFSS